MNDVMEKYRSLSVKGLFGNQCCLYCKEPIERDSYHPKTCAHCGAELAEETRVYARCYGVPVTDTEDYIELLKCSDTYILQHGAIVGRS